MACPARSGGPGRLGSCRHLGRSSKPTGGGCRISKRLCGRICRGMSLHQVHAANTHMQPRRMLLCISSQLGAASVVCGARPFSEKGAWDCVESVVCDGTLQTVVRPVQKRCAHPPSYILAFMGCLTQGEHHFIVAGFFALESYRGTPAHTIAWHSHTHPACRVRSGIFLV